MSGVWDVARRELRARVRGKGFWIGLVATSAAIVALVVVPSFFDDRTEFTVSLTGASAPALAAPVRALGAANGLDLDVTLDQDPARARAAVEDGDLDAAVVGSELLSKDEPDEALAAVVQAAHQQVRLVENLRAAGLDDGQVTSATTIEPLAVTRLAPGAGDERARQGLALVLMVCLLMLLMTSALGVAVGVVEEKGNRIVEILLIAVRPSQLLAGKLLAFGALGAIQLTVFALAGLVSASAVGLTDDLPTGAATIALAAGLGYLFGFAFFASLAAALGALVSRQEEVNGALGPLTTLMVCAYLGSYLALQDPGSTFARVLSVLPPFSSMVMPVRAATSDVGAAEVGAAVVLMTLAVGAIVLVAGKVYERSVLRTGSRVRLGEVIRLR